MAADGATDRPEAVAWHALDAGDVLRRLDASPGGLTSEEAARRLARAGPNELAPPPPRSAWRILADQFGGVVVWLLAVAAGVALLVGDVPEAAAIGAVLALNAALGFATELRARRAMEALRALEPARATVLRDGAPRELEARLLVPGDVLLLEAGARVPADARLLETAELRTVEAPLTGEPAPVGKRADAVAGPRTPLAERSSMIHMGTSVAAGSGRAVVVATGAATEVGRIGALAGAVRDEPTPLERRLDALGRRLVWVALGAGALVAGVGLLRGWDAARVAETALALAVAAVPEGLPAVATIALAVGVRRMARRRALVRRLPAVETLGSATVVCTDKTGTLTAGEMAVTELRVAGRTVHVSGTGYAPEGGFSDGAGRPVDPAADGALRRALRAGALANRAALEREDAAWTARGDPTEAALLAAAARAGMEPAALRRDAPEVGEVPFSSERMWMATLHRRPDGAAEALVKGAPHAVLDRCSRALGPDGAAALDDAARAALLEENARMAARGLRVLALADGVVEAVDGEGGGRGGASTVDAGGVRGLTWLGLAGIADPPAPGVRETVAALRDAGIRVLMVTGDQARTALAVAGELGMATTAGAMEGPAIDAASDAALAARLAEAPVLARVSPADKLRVVRALRGRGEVVAMLGDGVNDAAALRRADIGMAMGRRGTDVAREAADVVLQDDRFATVGAAVEEGRVVYDNVRKFVFYLFSCNLAEVGVLVGAGAVGLPLPLLPLQILWMNLVTDTFPALALALEPAEDGVMRRPPRDPRAPLLSRRFVRRLLFFAGLMTAATLAAFVWGLSAGDHARAVSLAFTTLALTQILHLGDARSRRHVLSPRRAAANGWALGAVALTVGLQLLALYLPPLAELLGLVPLAPRDWMVVVPLAAAPAVVGQALRWRAERR